MNTKISYETYDKLADIEYELFGVNKCEEDDFKLYNERSQIIAVDIPLQIIKICKEKQLHKPEIDLMIDILKKKLNTEYKLH